MIQAFADVSWELIEEDEEEESEGIEIGLLPTC